ncbi:MAG: hypothetical protein K0S45_3638 [Nitrospira sp.]|nr:hypothetical protein [Nitrospira sp.]
MEAGVPDTQSIARAVDQRREQYGEMAIMQIVRLGQLERVNRGSSRILRQP